MNLPKMGPMWNKMPASYRAPAMPSMVRPTPSDRDTPGPHDGKGRGQS